MKKKEIARKNYEFFCLPVGLAILNLDFSGAIIDSLSRPIKLKIDDNQNWGYLIISSQIKDCQRKAFVEKARNSFSAEIVRKIKNSIKGELNNEALVEIEGFCFKFDILKYELITQPNMSIIKIDELGEISGKESLGVIVDLKITSKK